MATKTQDSKSRGLIPWRKRAEYKPGKSKRQRQTQYKDQMQALMLVLGVAVVAAGLVVIINYQGAGSTKEVSCDQYPEFCVPFVGGATGGEFADLEAADSRELDAESEAAEGVVRGVWPEYNIPFIGDPDAPIHFVTVSDFSCSHCQSLHRDDVVDFIENYVDSGQATFGFVMTTGTGGPYSVTASQAALCAGEQGAFWEMSDELFRLGYSMGPANAFSLTEIQDSADAMGLDTDVLLDCVSSNRYSAFLTGFRTFANDNGVTGTPTVYYRYADSPTWSKVLDRTYSGMAALTEGANLPE